MKTKLTKVYAIVEGGLVQDVYSTAEVDLEVIDLDGTDSIEKHEAAEKQADRRRELKCQPVVK
jgi:hypothetical protein